MLNFLGELTASIEILLFILLNWGEDEFCIQYHDQMAIAFIIFMFIGTILFIIDQIKNY